MLISWNFVFQKGSGVVHLLGKKIIKWTIFGHSNTIIYNSVYKRKYGLEKKEIAFQYKYGAPLDFHSHSLMNLNIESHVVGKESRRVKVGT
jgi:hypothetical protein